MEDDPRSFEPVHIGMTSVETGRDRFTKDEVFHLPPLSYWRNNLTGLSQRFNLYFVASRDSIAVYRPEFPFQKLHAKPRLVIPPTLANPAAHGYIDASHPHAINHLVVGDLGTEEILLVSTDSGNVAAYQTQSIEEAIRKDPYRFSENARSDYVGVRAIFSQWVHESAWGLSIHTHGRMIAVSANTPCHTPVDDPAAKITVFAFALTEETTKRGDVHEADAAAGAAVAGANDEEVEWHNWVPSGSEASPPPRDKNYKITLGGVDGHEHNIPSISFVNTDEDTEGQWLLSTDIGGEMKVWQIWQGICFRTWDFAETASRAGWLRRTEGGWLVAALDPRAFRPATTMDQFCGHFKAPLYPGHAGESYDISNIVRLRTPGNSQAHPALNETSDEEDNSQESEDVIDSWSWSEPDDVIEENNSTALTERANPVVSALDSPSSVRVDQDALAGEVVVRSPARHEPNPSDHSDTADPEFEMTAQEELALGGDDAGLELESVYDDASEGEVNMDELEPEQARDSGNSGDDDMEDLSESDQGEESRNVSSASQHSTASLSSLVHRNSAEIDEERVFIAPPSATSARWRAYTRRIPTKFGKRLHRASVQLQARKHARLPFIPAVHCTTSHLRLLLAPNARSPHVFCAHILKQILPPIIEASQHSHLDRLNMCQQIPELGIVIIATQMGRCAVCTLTKHDQTGTLGVRVDWVLPTRRQEKRGVRPLSPLLGIAVGPVQGRIPQKENTSDRDLPGLWARDSVVDGVQVTFDPMTFALRASDESAEVGGDKHEEAESWRSTQEHVAKRKRPSLESEGLGSARADLHPWSIPEKIEPWRALENSRRYRLMLTYADLTVLTYEIYRPVERDDVAPTEASPLDLVD